MEAGTALCLVSGLLALASGASLAFSFADGVAGKSRAASRIEGGRAVRGRAAWLVRNGVSPLKPLACRLLRIRKVGQSTDDVVSMLRNAGYLATASSALSIVIGGAVLVLAAGWVLTANAVGGVALAACAVAALFSAAATARERRREAIREAVPDALRSMTVCFRSGLSLLQTMRQVGTEAKGPIGELFSHVAHLLETGGSTREALATFREGDSVPELSFVAVALDVQHQTGGSLERVLDAARESIESGLELERSLRVQTAQAKLSARIVSVMPLILVVLFSLVSDDFLAPFFSSFTGVALRAVAVSMQLAGVLIVRRTLKVEVS